MGSNEKSDKKEYPKKGYYLTARKIVRGELVRYPSAFVVFHCLLAWANFKEGHKPIRHNGKEIKLRAGQLPISPLDIGERIGMGVNTVRRALNFLVAIGCIKVDAAFDGTLITIPKYQVYQDKEHYKREREADPKRITPHESVDPKRINQEIHNGSGASVGSRSKIDHTVHRSNTDLHSVPEAIQTYFESLRLKKRRVSEGSYFSELLEDYSVEEVLRCFLHIRQHGALKTNQEVARPMSYLAEAIPDVLKNIRKNEPTQAAVAAFPVVEEQPVEMSMEDLEREYEELRKRFPEDLLRPLQKKLDEKRAKLAGGNVVGECNA